MKVSDPIIFGKCVEVFYKDLFFKYGKDLESVGVELKNGYGDLKMNSEVLEHFIDYITGVGIDKVGLRKGTPHYFAINNEGNASYYFFVH